MYLSRSLAACIRPAMNFPKTQVVSLAQTNPPRPIVSSVVIQFAKRFAVILNRSYWSHPETLVRECLIKETVRNNANSLVRTGTEECSIGISSFNSCDAYVKFIQILFECGKTRLDGAAESVCYTTVLWSQIIRSLTIEVSLVRQLHLR